MLDDITGIETVDISPIILVKGIRQLLSIQKLLSETGQAIAYQWLAQLITVIFRFYVM